MLQHAGCAAVKGKFRLACIAHNRIFCLKFCETFPHLTCSNSFALHHNSRCVSFYCIQEGCIHSSATAPQRSNCDIAGPYIRSRDQTITRQQEYLSTMSTNRFSPKSMLVSTAALGASTFSSAMSSSVSSEYTK